MEWIERVDWEGMVMGMWRLVIMGVFDGVVVKGEYYWGRGWWWIFVVLGMGGVMGWVVVSEIVVWRVLGVL